MAGGFTFTLFYLSHDEESTVVMVSMPKNIHVVLLNHIGDGQNIRFVSWMTTVYKAENEKIDV